MGIRVTCDVIGCSASEPVAPFALPIGWRRLTWREEAPPPERQPDEMVEMPAVLAGYLKAANRMLSRPPAAPESIGREAIICGQHELPRMDSNPDFSA